MLYSVTSLALPKVHSITCEMNNMSVNIRVLGFGLDFCDDQELEKFYIDGMHHFSVRLKKGPSTSCFFDTLKQSTSKYMDNFFSLQLETSLPLT